MLSVALGKRKLTDASPNHEKENVINMNVTTSNSANKDHSFFKSISVDLTDYTEVCLVCDLDLSGLTEEAKESHLDECLDRSGVEKGSLTQPDVITPTEERGLRNAEFFCVLCDVNLSRRKLVSRCLHLKKCAKEHRLSTKQLLQYIAPIAEEDDENDDEENDEQHNENENETTTKNALFKKQAMYNEVIDLCSDNEEQQQEGQVLAKANSTPAIPTKNAWAVLMSSSRQQNQMKGFFPTSSSTESTMIKANTVPTGNTKATATPSSSSSSTTPAGKRWGNKSSSSRYPSKQSAGNAGQVVSEYGNYAPAYKKIQVGNMTQPIIVDGFQYASTHLCNCYFLTHFHSDHYTGLRSDFDCGTIYCSIATAALVKQRLKVNGKCIIPLELERSYTITVGGVNVEFLFADANHCPGAVCILFRFPQQKLVLHTGDFRWCSQLLRSSQAFRSLASTGTNTNMKNLTVYLDTTYCDPEYNFPHQDFAINAVVECVREEAKKPGALFVFGSYSIGKERIFMAAAHELNCLVYVDKPRWKAMLCYGWPIEELARLTTTDAEKAMIWVVGMNQINFNHLSNLRQRHAKCNRIVAFQPTGWTYTDSKTPKSTNNKANNIPTVNAAPTNNILHAREKEGNIIYSVAYSEHSSFSELIEFIQTFRPCRVVPTVNTYPDKVQKQLQLLRDRSGVYNNNNPSSTTNDNAATTTHPRAVDNLAATKDSHPQKQLDSSYPQISYLEETEEEFVSSFFY